MPSVINVGALNINTPQQNSSIFVGETVLSGMDANMKYNTAHGGLYGFYDVIIANYYANIDNMEVADGNMYDQDFKPILGGSNV